MPTRKKKPSARSQRGPTLPSRDQLRSLSPRALVAYAVRNARRVQPLLSHLEIESDDLLALDRLLATIEGWLVQQRDSSEVNAAYRKVAWSRIQVATISAGNTDNIVTAFAASAVTDATARAADAAIAAAVADAAARAADAGASADSAMEAGHHAVRAADAALHAATAIQSPAEIVVQSATTDFQILSRLHAESIDATETGPCGALWHEAVPNWYSHFRYELNARLGRLSTTVSSGAQNITAFEEVTKPLQETINRLNEELKRQRDDARHELEQWRVRDERLNERRAIAEQELELLKKSREADQQRLADNFNELKRLQDVYQQLTVERGELRKQMDALLQQYHETVLAKEDLDRKLKATEYERELEQIQGWKWYKEKIFTPANGILFAAVLVLFVAVLVSILGISELHGRRSFDAQLESLAKSRDFSVTGNADGQQSVPERRDQIDAIRARLQLLSHAGARDFDESLAGLGYQLRAVFSPKSIDPPKPDRSFAWYWLPDWVARVSSDSLLSFVVMVSGTVGALMAGLRGNGRFRIRDFALGLAAGFVTFLAIRGGKSVFLVDGGDTTLMLNPYNSAFLGVLTGLFTDLAYELLRDFAQEIVKRLRSAFLSDPRNEAAKSASPAAVATPAIIAASAE